jgi:hypothetical protein
VARRIGFYLDTVAFKRFDLAGVSLDGAERATWGFDYVAGRGDTIEYRFNQGALHRFSAPSQLEAASGLRAFAVDVPLSELVDGGNVLEVREVSSSQVSIIGNMELLVEPAR